MRRSFLALAFVAALAMPALGKDGVGVVNLMPAFFRADASGVALNVRVQRFKEDVVRPNADLYDPKYFALDDQHIAQYLGGLDPSLASIRSSTDAIEGSMPAHEASFEAAFPKFDPHTVSIYLMPSMGNFDGMTRDVNGQHALLIGVDAFAREQFPLGIFLAHEMFHIYQHEVNPAFFVTASENDLYEHGLYRQLWAEGLATFVSQKLNPGASNAAVLASSDLANLSGDDVRRLACFVDRRLDSQHAGDAALLFDASQHPRGLPARGGYYIGYLVASDLGKTYSLADLADLNGNGLREAIGTRVHAICGDAQFAR